jgi:hypothetical protein
VFTRTRRPMHRAISNEGVQKCVNFSYRPAAAIGPGGSRDCGLLELGDRHHPRGEEVEQDSHSARDAAIAIAPASDTSWADAKQLSDACDTERAECRAKFGRGRMKGHADVI